MQRMLLSPLSLRERNLNMKKEGRISIWEAMDLVCRDLPVMAEREVFLTEGLGQVLSRDVYTLISQPPFPRSAMDGYALKAEETLGASGASPKLFKLAGCQYAGDPYFRELKAGEALRIMTGAAIPEGADAVVRQEDTEEKDGQVAVLREVKAWQNYCPVGEDFSSGECLAKAGDRVDAFLISAAAAAGVENFRVRSSPRVSILTTGDEIQEPGTELKEGKIYNSHTALFMARLRQMGCRPAIVASVGDEDRFIRDKISEAAGCSDLIITTGGVSVGLKDCLPRVMEELNARIVFHGISVKPGMPTMFSLYKDVPVLSLSGNPYSASAIFELLVQPMIKKMTLSSQDVLKKVVGKSSDSYKKNPGPPRFLRGYYEDGEISFGKDQRNGQTRAGIGSNCLICLEEGRGPVETGDPLTAYLLY